MNAQAHATIDLAQIWFVYEQIVLKKLAGHLSTTHLIYGPEEDRWVCFQDSWGWSY